MINQTEAWNLSYKNIEHIEQYRTITLEYL